MKILLKSINSVLLRFSYLSPATSINIFDLSLSEITCNRQVDRQHFDPCNLLSNL